MKLSLITPTHDTTYLQETYKSILRQRYQDWEWVLVPNNGARIPLNILQESRVKILDGGLESNIGALKRLGCQFATGDAFIELDHDDMLMPGEALDAIANKFRAGAGFVYSDTVLYAPSYNTTRVYGGGHGWQSYTIKLYGREVKVNRCFPITARVLCEIYYAPDHVRAWSKEVYNSCGGHNKEFSVGDDHELMIKTYLNHASFMHTGGCHYIYRFHPNNTVKHRNTLIQEQVRINRRKYTDQLILEEARRKNWITLDLQKLKAAGWQFERDLQHGFGPDSSIGVIRCHDMLQYCPPERLTEFFNRCYAALIPGGYLDLKYPNALSSIAYVSPEYKSYLTTASILGYVDKQFKTPDVNCRFQRIDSFVVEDNISGYSAEEYAFSHCRVYLTTLKGQWQPATQLI